MKSFSNTSRALVVAILLIGPWGGVSTGRADALASILRGIGKVADNVPIDSADDLAQRLARQGDAGGEAVDDVLKRAGHGGDELVDATRRARAVRGALDELLIGVDPSAVRQLDELDDAAKEGLLVLGTGARRVEKGIPDIAARGNFLKSGGPETLAAVGRYDDLFGPAVRFDTLIRSGTLVPPPGASDVSLRTFGRFFEEGDRARGFWTKYVQGKEKLWMTGSAATALVAIMLTPDEYLDEFGNLIEAKVEKLVGFGGEIVAGLVKGSVDGAGAAGKEIAKAAVESVRANFFSDLWGLPSLAVVAAIVAVAILFFVPWSRRIPGAACSSVVWAYRRCRGSAPNGDSAGVRPKNVRRSGARRSRNAFDD